MRHRSWPVAIAALLVATACSAPGPVLPGPTSSPTSSPPFVAVSFPAADGVALVGRTYGQGTTAVILSNMGDNDPAPWQRFAPLLAARGYLVLTYSFRYPLRTNAFSAAMAIGTVADLRGAASYVRRLGARRLVLVGASLGGITTGKLAGELDAAAMVVISAEQDLSSYGLSVSAAELAAMTGPKLFVGSEDDSNTPFALTQAFYANAGVPKRLHAYPGGVHGVGIFDTANGDDLRQLLVSFVSASAPPG